MYERLYLNVFYSGLLYINSNNNLPSTVAEIEISNIQQSNPVGALKDQLMNSVASTTLYNYLSSTKSAPTGGNLWSVFTSQNFVTPYISDLVQNSFEVLTPKEFSSSFTSPVKLENLKNIQPFLESSQTTTTSIFDTYPFRIDSFGGKMASKPSLNQRYTTTNSYTFNDKKLIITNNESKTIKPFTRKNKVNDSYTDTIITNNKIKNFYFERYSSDNKNYLEGNVKYTTDNNLGTQQTVNILNTPYFINSIIEAGNSPTDDLTKVGYLFLNSLPLSTMYEKYLASEGDEDYIFAS